MSAPDRTPPIAADRLRSIGVVVRDLDKAMRRYAEIFGIDVWEVRDLGPEQLSDLTSHGRPIGAPSLRVATATSVPPSDQGWLFGGENTPVPFELIQPIGGESPFLEFRFLRRHGICHLKLAEVTADEFATMRDALAQRGVPVAASMTVDGRVERHFFDTRPALGGYLVEIDVVVDGRAPAVAGTRIDHSGGYTRPDGVGPVPIFGVNHFGVVVPDVLATIERYSELFGITGWNIRAWRTEPGSLECPFYRGEQVDHEYLTALSPFRDFGWEIIQPTHGPSHYNREFADLYGSGVHHMLLNTSASAEEWDRTREWLASIDVPVVMGGGLGKGMAEFAYYDTTDALGGYILEGFVLRQAPTEAPTPDPMDYRIDFAALTDRL